MAVETETESRTNLNELTKIPAKEFELHFREWMERDDVARGLQAKLRCDLISNFNKTALGKQILSQTATMTRGPGGSHRLTLSPLTLALNTLVAEFLYAQNCHFTLSVFCTEVPYRNTLPDFESTNYFRFNDSEMADIFQAISSTAKCDRNLEQIIAQNYVQNANMSLLFIIFRVLLEQPPASAPAAAQNPLPTTRTAAELEAEKLSAAPKAKTTASLADGGSNAEREQLKAEIYNKNFRYLNKYLLVLSARVKEMVQQFENFKQRRPVNTKAMPRPRMKAKRAQKSENLNRSLEHVAENLKQMLQEKQLNKQVGGIVKAIDSMATQFAKCAESFESVSHELITKKSPGGVYTEKATSTETPEKSYMDWLYEMRHTQNGRKFLDRIEISLRKALDKQTAQLNDEMDQKLRSQRELLRIRYKQKLIQRLSKHASSDFSEENRKFNENIDQHLKGLEQKHLEMVQKLKEKEMKIADTEVVEVANKVVVEIKAHPEPKLSQDLIAKPKEVSVQANIPNMKTAESVINYVANTQQQFQKMVKDITQQERNIDHIVYDAKLRIQELENESNQLEQNFRNYLDRQKQQQQELQSSATILLHNYSTEQPKRARSLRLVDICQDEEAEEEAMEDLINKVPLPDEMKFNRLQQQRINKIEPNNCGNEVEFKNAILEAREKLFTVGKKYSHPGEKVLMLDDFMSPDEVKSEVNRRLEAVKTDFYSGGFGNSGSQKLGIENRPLRKEPSAAATISKPNLHVPLGDMCITNNSQFSNSMPSNLSPTSDSASISVKGSATAKSSTSSSSYVLRKSKRQLSINGKTKPTTGTTTTTKRTIHPSDVSDINNSEEISRKQSGSKVNGSKNDLARSEPNKRLSEEDSLSVSADTAQGKNTKTVSTTLQQSMAKMHELFAASNAGGSKQDEMRPRQDHIENRSESKTHITAAAVASEKNEIMHMKNVSNNDRNNRNHVRQATEQQHKMVTNQMELKQLPHLVRANTFIVDKKAENGAVDVMAAAYEERQAEQLEIGEVVDNVTFAAAADNSGSDANYSSDFQLSTGGGRKSDTDNDFWE